LEGEEAALLADTMAGGEAGPPMTALAGADPREHASADAAPPVPGPADSGPAALPGLDELVARIPDPVREALDELFRARFIAVRRYPAQPTEA
jgi:hypothetical protein